MPQTMKTYKEFIQDIQESSLSRIQSKSKKSGVAAISADRGNLSRKENQARSQQLQKDIRGKFGRGPTKVKGSYLENPGSKDERKVKEKSYVIDRGKMGKRKFKKEVKKLGTKYGQDSVLTQTKKTGTLHSTRKGKPLGISKDSKGRSRTKGDNVGRFQPQGKNPYGQSQIKGKTFAYNK